MAPSCPLRVVLRVYAPVTLCSHVDPTGSPHCVSAGALQDVAPWQTTLVVTSRWRLALEFHSTRPAQHNTNLLHQVRGVEPTTQVCYQSCKLGMRCTGAGKVEPRSARTHACQVSSRTHHWEGTGDCALLSLSLASVSLRWTLSPWPPSEVDSPFHSVTVSMPLPGC